MKKIISLFFNISDYCYYSLAKANMRQDGTAAPTALWSVSMMQAFLAMIFFVPLSASAVRYLTNSSRFAAYPTLAFILLIAWLNHRRYNRKYLELRVRWQHEPPRQRRVRKFLANISVFIALAVLICAWGILHKLFN